MEFLKSLFKSDNAYFKEITPEFLAKQRQGHLGDAYVKWLRAKNGQLQAFLIARKEVSGIIPAEWSDKLVMVEQAIEKEQG